MAKKNIEKLFRKALFDFQLLENIGRLAIALSGGKDSLTMLYLLKAVINRGFPDVKLFAIHVDGDISCGAEVDKSYLTDICKKLDVPLVIKKNDFKFEKKIDCYICSRIRRKILFQSAHELNISTIAFGHHKDDTVETLMMNLLQKGEFASMLPKIKMIDYDMTIIRPMIYISEKEIIEFAKKNNFIRLTCQCPHGAKSRRKDVKNILSEIEYFFPFAKNNLFQAGQIYGSKKALNK